MEKSPPCNRSRLQTVKNFCSIYFMSFPFFHFFSKIMKLNNNEVPNVTPVAPVRLSPIATDESPVRLMGQEITENEQHTRTPQVAQAVRAARARGRRPRRQPKRTGRSAGRRNESPARLMGQGITDNEQHPRTPEVAQAVRAARARGRRMRRRPKRAGRSAGRRAAAPKRTRSRRRRRRAAPRSMPSM